MMEDIAEYSMSYFDTAKNKGKHAPENFYHGLVLGLIVSMRKEYRIVSNRESGEGRYDIAIYPFDKTKDLILKKAEFEDWKTIYYNLWRHKESAKYMLWQPTETDEDAKDRMKRTIAFEEKPENKYALFVYLKKTGEAIGFAGMRELEPGIYEETGIALGPEFVQKGYGRQILTTLLEEAGKLGAKEFHACNRIGNAASRVLQLSCGFVFDSLSEEKTDPRTGETYVLENHIYRY